MKKIIALYYNTICRNLATQKTECIVKPINDCAYAVNGLLRCSGVTGIYEKDMPVALTGTIDKGSIFRVTSDTVYNKTYDHCEYILRYVSKQLSDAERQSIIDAASNDLFSFVQEKSAKDTIVDILSRTRVKDDGNRNSRKQVQKLAGKICKDLSRLSAREETANALMEYHVPIDRIESMIRQNITLTQIKNNSYWVLQTHDIPFRYADIFSFNNTPVREYSPARLRGIVFEALRKTRQNGHTYCLLRQLATYANYIAANNGVYHTEFNRSLTHYCVTAMESICQYHEVNGIQIVYLNHIWDEETLALQHLKRLQTGKKQFSVEHSIDEIEDEIGITYNAGQREAFNLLSSSGVKILTGPPGSGKTAVINGLIRSFQLNHGGNVKLAATTGRAAKVMANACGRESVTVHRMLNIVPYEDTAKGRDLNNPIDADFIIVDEVSMLGLQMFSALLQAVKSGSILLLVGDEDQLQSVDYGNVLHDLIRSECVETCRLTDVMRQSGSICANARAINCGSQNLILDNAFEVIPCDDVNDLWINLQNRYAGDSSQILCPVRHGEISVDSLNELFADENEPIIVQYGANAYRMHSKVIMTKTDYDRGYVNGDIGYIVDSTINNDLVVEFDDRTMVLEKRDLPNMSLATAITIHKSQGSECDYIHIVLPPEAGHMMTRRLVYTAITRAKKKVMIYDIAGSLRVAMKNAKEKRRQTALCERLKMAFQD